MNSTTQDPIDEGKVITLYEDGHDDDSLVTILPHPGMSRVPTAMTRQRETTAERENEVETSIQESQNDNDVDIDIEEEDGYDTETEIQRGLSHRRDEFQNIADEFEKINPMNVRSPYQDLPDAGGANETDDFGELMSKITTIVDKSRTYLATSSYAKFKRNLPGIPANIQEARVVLNHISRVAEALWSKKRVEQIQNFSGLAEQLRKLHRLELSCEFDHQALEGKIRRLEAQQARLKKKLRIAKKDREDVTSMANMLQQFRGAAEDKHLKAIEGWELKAWVQPTLDELK